MDRFVGVCACESEKPTLGNKQIALNLQGLSLISISIREQSYSLNIPMIYLIT
jgi:hypothetical protein